MHYFTNSQLKAQYGVSYAAINRWIQSAKAGKNDLTLYEENGKSHIANTSKNELVLEKLVSKGKKYLNSKAYKVITPKPEFYKTYDRAQILDIIKELNMHHEVPTQYVYFGKGANYWDEYVNRLLTEENANLLNSTINLMKLNYNMLDLYLKDCTLVNVIDVGSGNGLPIRDLLRYLIDKGIGVRYIAVDTSKELLNILSGNIRSWFGDEVDFVSCNRDMRRECFNDVIPVTMDDDAEKTLSIVTLFGGTVLNFKSPNEVFSIIYNSIYKEDLIIYSTKLDSAASRRYFDIVWGESDVSARMPEQEQLVVDMLNISPSLYEVESGYDDNRKQRYVRMRLKVAILLNFRFEEGEKSIEFSKGDTILLWRAKHQSAEDVFGQLRDSGFTLLHSSLDANREYLFTISTIETQES